MISGSNLPIQDAIFYCDDRLANTNVYNVTIAINDYETLYPDLYTVMKSYCKICILQQSSIYHCKFTFITSVEPILFNKILNLSIVKLRKIRNLTENQITLL